MNFFRTLGVSRAPKLKSCVSCNATAPKHDKLAPRRCSNDAAARFAQFIDTHAPLDYALARRPRAACWNLAKKRLDTSSFRITSTAVMLEPQLLPHAAARQTRCATPAAKSLAPLPLPSWASLTRSARRACARYRPPKQRRLRSVRPSSVASRKTTCAAKPPIRALCVRVALRASLVFAP